MSSTPAASSKLTAPALRSYKASGKKLVVVTAYDATFARLLEEGGADVLLVGDSLGMVVQGQQHTLPVTLEEMAYHSRAVARVARRAQVVVDMPFLSYQTSPEDALRSAGYLVQKGSAEAVKLEGGARSAEGVHRIVQAGIPVMGHIGLTPQSVHAMGGFRLQGRDADAAAQLSRDARALQDAGAYAIVIEGVPASLARQITGELEIPTIGIGAGADCDGQVLVCYDYLGLVPDFRPKFVKRYAELGAEVIRATQAFAEEIRSGAFPSAEHSFSAQPTPDAARASVASSGDGAPQARAASPAGRSKRARARGRTKRHATRR